VALEYQGDLALDLGNHVAALDSFTRLAARGDALCQNDFQSSARRGQAHALSHLARRGCAGRRQAALALARDHGDASARSPRSTCWPTSTPALPGPELMMAPNAGAALPAAGAGNRRHHRGLHRARHAARCGGARVRRDRRLRARLRISLQANAARDQTHSKEATNRAIAMQVQYQTERAQTEGEHHRQLAAAEAQRAEVLQQTSATLEHLSAIGQEITAHLDAAAVFRALDRHVHGLLDATHFSIFLLEPDGETLVCSFGIEAGNPLPPIRVPLSSPSANSARCVRERREILIELDEEGVTPHLIPGTLPTLTCCSRRCAWASACWAR
jgi:hypothetical protein